MAAQIDALTENMPYCIRAGEVAATPLGKSVTDDCTLLLQHERRTLKHSPFF